MDELNIQYSEKNIGLHSKDLIKRTLISRTEDVLRRMRWKLFHIRNPTFNSQKERSGFKTTNSPPAMHKLFKFESDLISMTKNIKFKPANNDINRRITILEIIQLASVGLASHNIRVQVPSNIPVHNQFLKSEHLKTTQ